MIGWPTGVAARTSVAPNLDVRDRRMIGWATLAGVIGRPASVAVAVPIPIPVARRAVITSVIRVLIATACGRIGTT
jgi:hypothetical protein